MSRTGRIPRWHMRQWRAAYDAEHGARQHGATSHARAVAALRESESGETDLQVSTHLPAAADTSAAESTQG